MKLLLCKKKCTDVFSLKDFEKKCTCGETKGYYTDSLNAVYSGDFAVPLGFTNSSFCGAINSQPQTGNGKEFTAFIIPLKCNTFIKI